MGADVSARLYPNVGHAINQEELDIVRGIVDQVAAR
jgi:predicted esterase